MQTFLVLKQLRKKRQKYNFCRLTLQGYFGLSGQTGWILIHIFFFLSFIFLRKSRLVNDFSFVAPLATRDQKDILDTPDPQEGPANQEMSVHREVLDPKANPVLKVLLDPRALPWNVTGNNVFIKVGTKKKTLA